MWGEARGARDVAGTGNVVVCVTGCKQDHNEVNQRRLWRSINLGPGGWAGYKLSSRYFISTETNY